MNRYVLERLNFRRLTTKLGVPKCVRCGEDLQVGQKIVGKSGKGGRRYYHENCWDSLFIEVKP